MAKKTKPRVVKFTKKDFEEATNSIASLTVKCLNLQNREQELLGILQQRETRVKELELSLSEHRNTALVFSMMILSSDDKLSLRDNIGIFRLITDSMSLDQKSFGNLPETFLVKACSEIIPIMMHSPSTDPARYDTEPEKMLREATESLKNILERTRKSDV